MEQPKEIWFSWRCIFKLTFQVYVALVAFSLIAYAVFWAFTNAGPPSGG